MARWGINRVLITGPTSARDRGYLRAILQYNFQFPEIRAEVLMQQARFMYANPGVEFVTVFDFMRHATGTNWINAPSGTRWSAVRPLSVYGAAAAASVRVAQLLRSAGDIQVHLVILILDRNDIPSTKTLFPMWSPTQLRHELVPLVERLRPGFREAALLIPALAMTHAELFQEIYY